MNPRQLLNLFKYQFDENRTGVVVTLDEIHEEFAYRNKAGAIDKINLETLINALIEAGKVEVLSNTEFKIVRSISNAKKYAIPESVLQDSHERYASKQGEMRHPLYEM